MHFSLQWRCLLGWLYGLAVLFVNSGMLAERYNLISIVTDDQATWSVGAYGNPDAKTPHLDRLAEEGALFTKAFVCSPVCSPSRATYLTGRYPTQIGITDWIAPHEAAEGLGLPPELPIWPEVLRGHGYRTALIGKWHLGDQAAFHPNRRGLDHFFGFLGGGNAPMHPRLERNGMVKRYEGYGANLLTDDALAFISRNQERPFALLLHFREPHAPYAPVPEADAVVHRDVVPEVPRSKGMDLELMQRLTREYHSSVHSVDRNVGRVLALLDQLQLSERTIVLFTSDHGYMIGHHGLRHKGNAHWYAGGVRGPKRPNMFDHAIRVPLLIRWPEVVRGGRRVDAMVSQLDTFRTILGMLDVPMPEGVRTEGRDFSSLLRGEAYTPRRSLLGQYDLHNSGLAYMRMIRTEKWKLVRHFKTHFLDELYDLEQDPEELRNLYRRNEHAGVRESLNDLLHLRMQQLNDPLLRDPY